jgi:hypothetical protein
MNFWYISSWGWVVLVILCWEFGRWIYKKVFLKPVYENKETGIVITPVHYINRAERERLRKKFENIYPGDDIRSN